MRVKIVHFVENWRPSFLEENEGQFFSNCTMSYARIGGYKMAVRF